MLKWFVKRDLKSPLIALVFVLSSSQVLANSTFYDSARKRFSRLSAAQKLQKLNFPKLPKHVASQKVLRVDTLNKTHWGMNRIGFFNVFDHLSQPKKGIQSCSPSIVVAVVDTGLDYSHPEFRDNLWKNPGEVGPWSPPLNWKAPKGILATCRDKSCNGIDDDKNGFTDDVVGWDFVHDVPLPYDAHGHGTHIAGIIASRGGNGQGIAGVCPAVSIMALKYYDNSVLGYSNLNNTVRAIRYAVQNGAHIINYSGGGSDPAPAEMQAIREARAKNILFVAAAGNNGRDNDWVPYYPASYGLDNIISVASINRQGTLLPSSNYGLKAVDIAAPGLDVLSTLPGSTYGKMSGTSQATAFVTGAAALLASQLKQPRKFKPKDIKHFLTRYTQPISGKHVKKKMRGGILSLPKALAAQKKNGQPVAVPPAIASKKPTKRIR